MTTNAKDRNNITVISVARLKSALIGPSSTGKITFLNASTPYVSGFSLVATASGFGRSLTGYMAPERKNIGITIKFMITLKLS